MLSFTNLTILSIKHKISKAWDRCSCPAMISYVSVPCKHMCRTPGQRGTVLGKAEQHRLRNTVAIRFLSLGADKLPWMAEGCTSDVHFTSEMQDVPMQAFYTDKSESVTDTGQKQEKTISVSRGGHRRQAAVNFEWQELVIDLIALSSQWPQIQSQVLLWGAFYQKQKVLTRQRNQQPEASGEAGGEALGGCRDRPSQKVSMKSDGPFPLRQCNTGAFNIARITSIHRFNLSAQRQSATVFLLWAQPVSISSMGSSYGFLQGLSAPASHLTFCTSSYLYMSIWW